MVMLIMVYYRTMASLDEVTDDIGRLNLGPIPIYTFLQWENDDSDVNGEGKWCYGTAGSYRFCDPATNPEDWQNAEY